jgi:uncharacterized protein DUF3303
MSLFVVEHRHDPDRCPAQNPQMAPMLLRHLSEDNAKAQGVAIHGEAVVDNAHQLVLILDAPDKETVDRFMQPFAQAGSVEILPASPCEAVVGRGSC